MNSKYSLDTKTGIKLHLLDRSFEHKTEIIHLTSKVAMYEMMMNTVCNSIYYLLYINPNMYK